MFNFFLRLFDTTGFPPRWKCGAGWHDDPGLGWLHIISDVGVGTAYVAIPLVLVYFVLNRRKDLPFQTVFWLFGAFILACGSTHFMDASLFYWPAYRLAGLIKLFTALVSWATVLALVPIVPKALSLKSPSELEREVAERKRAEEALRVAHRELERRVAERTAELGAANTALQAEIAERQRTEDRLRDALAERDRLLIDAEAARDEAEAANRLKDEFLANLSHELRTPLNAILGWSQLLRTGAPASQELEQGLETIERNAQMQTRIIEDLLDVSRIISGKLRLDVQVVRLSEVVQGALDSITPAAQAKGITLQPVIDPQAGLIAGDPARLQQVVWNLLSNAVKFTPRDGQVRLTVERVDSHIEIIVSDTGAGIPADFLPYVFDRFRQLDSSSTRRIGGLGLGLSIVRQLVELHGGSVEATSAGAGQGAKFVVKLPIAALRISPEDEPPRERPRVTPEGNGRKQRASLTGLNVLVVDDEPDARELIRRVLVEAGATATVCGSAGEAIEALARERPQVLISDIGMPEQDGYELLRQVRRIAAFKALPAIALTAFARSEDRQRALLAGFQMHLAKPVDAAELTIVVASLAGRVDGAAV